MITVKIDTSDLDRFKRKITDPQLMAKVFEGAGKELGREAVRLYESTTRTWDHKPEFETLIDSGPDKTEVLVGTDDPIYGYVDKGTRAHEIKAKTKKGLWFRSGYKAKTFPNTLTSTAGGPFGNLVGSKTKPIMVVHHPGIKARNFSQKIQAYLKNNYSRVVTKWIRKVWKGKR